MSAPRRWKDSPIAPVGMRELLGSARPLRPLDEGAFRRGAERLTKISVAPATAAAAVGIWTKLAAAGVVGLAAAGIIVSREARRDDRTVALVSTNVAATSVSPVVAPAPVVPPEPELPSAVVAPPVVEPSSRAVRRPAASPRARAAVDQPAPAPVDTASSPWIPEASRSKRSLSDELAILEAARHSMARDPEMALAKLAEHRARHPRGVLADERELMELDALRRTGRTQQARERAQAWLARDPNGMHAARVRRILATLD